MNTSRQVLTIFSTNTLWLALILILCGSLALPLSAQVQEKDVITWVKVNIPPVFILEGPHAGTGTLDRLTDFMIEQLEQYDHRIEILPNGSRLAARPSPEYRKMLEWFVSPKEQEGEYWKLYEEHVLTVFE